MATPGAVVSSVNQTIVTALNIHEPQALNKLVLKAPSEFESIAAIMEIIGRDVSVPIHQAT